MPTCEARNIPADILNYSGLSRQADTVLIITVASPSTCLGTQQQYRKTALDNILTKFTVNAVLKGKYAAPTFEFNHFAYPKARKNQVQMIQVSPWGFIWFGQKHQQFLVFLKHQENLLVPVSGIEDAMQAFIPLPADYDAWREERAGIKRDDNVEHGCTPIE